MTSIDTMLLPTLLFLSAFGNDMPTVSWSSSKYFQRTVFRLQEVAEKGDFNQMVKSVDRLPKRTFSIEWDESAVPSGSRDEFRKARDKAIANWADAVRGMKVTFEKHGDIHVDFEKFIKPIEEGGIPLGATFMDSIDPKDPTLDVTIALRRTTSKISISAREVENEVGYAIGRYFGLADATYNFTYLSRADTMYVSPHQCFPEFGKVVEENLNVIEWLRKAAKTKSKLRAVAPQLFVDTTKLEHEPVIQGEQVPFTLSISNRGQAPLSVRLQPDCSCTSVSNVDDIAPGDTVLLRVNIDTTQIAGEFSKRLLVFSNDPESQLTEIPLKVFSRPQYRLLRQSREPVLVMDKSGLNMQLFFIPVDVEGMKPTKLELTGMKAVCDWESWSGELADPEMNEKAKPRKGYKIKILGSPNLPNGRFLVTLFVNTSHPTWGRVATSFYVQRGIAVMPSGAYLGEVGKDPSSALVTLTRPGKPFKIKSILSTHSAVSATAKPNADSSEYAITLNYKGGAKTGSISGDIIIETDSSEQPKLSIPFSGVVK